MKSYLHQPSSSSMSFVSHSSIGALELATQKRVVSLFRDKLGYDYLGDWTDRVGNSNIELDLARGWLAKQGVAKPLIERALTQLEKVAGDTSKSLYDRNHAVYDLLRYGVKIKPDVGVNNETVFLIDWKNPGNNHFAIAEEVSVPGADARAHVKRPDIVLYVNGIALGVLELKRSTVSVTEGIRQNLDNQKKIFIEHFFSTMQWIMAGNDTEGLHYGTVQTPEKYYLTWKEDGPVKNLLDRALLQVCAKARFLELIHDFIVFDAGTKKLCRHSQYFGVKAAQERVRRREGGVIWHTQGSGKSLVMVWLSKWIRENAERNGRKDARVLIITDRTELDQQIETVYKGVNEEIERTKSGADLIAKLNSTTPWLMCSLIHKFGGKEDGEEVGDIEGYIEEVKKALPPDFKAKGDLYVFVDECHRTQSGELHQAMKSILPDAMFIGFTGTPLLKADKQKSIEVFGRYIHTYKYDEAVRDKVVLDLRYEARDIDQNITSQDKIDQWFAVKTQGLTDLAKAQLKQRWGTMKKVLSCQDRLEKIVADILMDMETRDRLKSGRGNALLVCASIYQACKTYELFSKTDLAGKCAIVTSYKPTVAEIKGEESGEGLTERLRKYDIYQKMLADWFNEAPEKAVNRIEEFEKKVKEKFIKEPGQMKLLIVVDKLLTGFDAPPATVLYIDKQMQDHGLFQAICRVNRLDGDDKEYGYIIDYKDLFKSLEGAVHDYTSGAFDKYDKADVAGLLQDRLGKAKERLTESLESMRALCEQVEPPKDQHAYLTYFSSKEAGNATQLKENEPKRLSLYKLTAALVRAYADIANEMTTAEYTVTETDKIKAEVTFYENLRNEVKLHSGDAVDLKQYEPAMRHLIDTYIRADHSVKVSEFDDLSLIQLIVERGEDALKALPDGIRKNREAAAEAIENNVRKLIIDETPINPKYYEKMSDLLDALILQRKQGALDYRMYLAKIVELTKQAKNGPGGTGYPKTLNTPAKRALYDNLGNNEILVAAIDKAIHENRQDDWRHNPIKVKKVRLAIKKALEDYGNNAPDGIRSMYSGAAMTDAADYTVKMSDQTEAILELVKNQNEY
jgi:type I restriction enzyme R subunit